MKLNEIMISSVLTPNNRLMMETKENHNSQLKAESYFSPFLVALIQAALLIVGLFASNLQPTDANCHNWAS